MIDIKTCSILLDFQNLNGGRRKPLRRPGLARPHNRVSYYPGENDILLGKNNNVIRRIEKMYWCIKIFFWQGAA